MNGRYDLEALSAYVDGEMNDRDATALLQAMKEDPVLREQVRELREMHDLVRYSFSHADVGSSVAMDVRRPIRQRRPLLRHGLVAALLLVVGAVAGWTAQWSFSISPAEGVEGNALRLAGTRLTAGTRTILHVSSGDTATLLAALDEAEQLLRRDTGDTYSPHLEIIANGAGLALLRDDLSPARERVLRMQRQYGNLSFLACRRTLERLRLESGLDAPLLPGVDVVPSALDRILLRLREGWSYVKA